MSQKFKSGDICICSYPLMKKANKSMIKKRDCRVRIIREIYTNTNGPVYSTYNIDFERYDRLGERFLTLDLQYIRDKKLNEILN
jgi:hypothetical protein